jgi:hypothetical protein
MTSSMTPPSAPPQALPATTYTVRRKVFKLFGNAFHVYDAQGRLLFYSKQKAFKLREDIRLYTGEDMQTEVLHIQARQIIDFSAAYDVYDSMGRQKVGALKRKGWKSLVRDEWILMDASDREIGVVKEDSTGLALLRRFVDAVSFFFPQKFHVEVAGRPVCLIKQHFNPFVYKLTLDFSANTQGLLDPRMGIAAGLLLAAIEGRQD